MWINKLLISICAKTSATLLDFVHFIYLSELTNTLLWQHSFGFALLAGEKETWGPWSSLDFPLPPSQLAVNDFPSEAKFTIVGQIHKLSAIILFGYDLLKVLRFMFKVLM